MTERPAVRTDGAVELGAKDGSTLVRNAQVRLNTEQTGADYLESVAFHASTEAVFLRSVSAPPRFLAVVDLILDVKFYCQPRGRREMSGQFPPWSSAPFPSSIRRVRKYPYTSSVDRRNVSDGNSPKQSLYAREKSPKCQKPQRSASVVTVVEACVAVRSDFRT